MRKLITYIKNKILIFNMKNYGMKGITPVIAIVLLLLVTVGAVGVVYTQFQDIANSGNTEFNTQARQIDLQITSMTESSDGDISLTITNGQGSVGFNTSEFLQAQFYPNGASSQEAVPFSALNISNVEVDSGDSEGCFVGSGQLLDPGQSMTCDTNVNFPSASEYIGIVVQVQGGANRWSSECSPRTTTSVTC